VRGAVIVGQDGVNVKYKKKCLTCGHADSSWHTAPIRNGVIKAVFFCPKCRKSRDVEIKGSLN
jgi:transposase-like protein